MTPQNLHYRWSGDDLILQFRVSTRASSDGFGDIMGDRLKVAITSPPVDGKANAHLTKFLAKQFGVSKSQVTITNGLANRDKTIVINSPAKVPEKARVRQS